MKQFFTILIIALSVNSFAQKSNSTGGIPHSQLNLFGNIDTRLNSWRDPTPAILKDFYIANISNDQNNQNKKEQSVIQVNDSLYSWIWDTNIPGWKPSQKTIYTGYDANNNATGTVSQNWDGSAWVNSVQHNYTYDANNNRIVDLNQRWNGNTWVISLRFISTYDASNNLTSELSQDWNGIEWVNFTQIKYTYDANNNMIGYLFQQWNGIALENSYQSVSTYDANNNVTCQTLQSWNGSAWVNAIQYISIHDVYNNLTSYTNLNWDGTTWVNSYQSNYTYDANNNLTYSLTLKWDGNAWVNSKQENDTYDVNNNRTSLLTQNWAYDTWWKSLQFVFVYDPDNFILSAARKSWGINDVNPYSGDSTNYYFHLITTGINKLNQKENFSIYPNPATDKITLTTGSLMPGETIITILNLKGQIIKEASFRNHKQVDLNVSSISKGIYLLKISSGTGVETKKLVIQ